MLLDAFFGGLFERLESLINQAQNAGNAILMQAGKEAYLIVQDVRYAYLDMLDKTMDEINQQIRTTLDELDTMVDDVVSGALSALDDLMDRAQLIVNTLPLADEQPQVLSVIPH